MKGRFIALTMAITVAALFMGCSKQSAEELEYIPPELERYENHIEIDGQWGASNATGADGQYGIGDPFVLRYNGKYYLYPSTSDPCDGIKVFESDDLVHWEDKGFAVAQSEATVHGAYAPEVVYYNGYFYLCQSRAGKGHYIYRSESPTEGFQLISKTDGDDEDSIDYGNLGMGIDGSFYVSDDGKLYLLHTSTPAGLKYNEITDVNDIRIDTLGKAGNLETSNLHGWIEGPGIFRRGDFSYLTYTGNHVISRGYRVAYSYAENMKNLSSFIQPTDNVTLIDTDEEHYGVGHASNVNGPDLDSVYTAYHTLVGRGPARRYNLDRYLASGSILTANGVTHHPVAMPSAPTVGGYKEVLTFEEGNGYVLGRTQDYFTAEYNFIPSGSQQLFFGDAKYTISLNDGVIALTKNSGAKSELLGKATVFAAEGRFAVVRIENGDGIGYLYFNGMRVISWKAEGAAGAIGYATDEGVGYTAFSNDVFGSSDFETFKNFPTKFPATSYLKGENRGFSIAKAKRVAHGVRVGEKESTVRIGDANAVALAKGDWVKYAVDVWENGVYTIAAEVSPKSAGAKIKIKIGMSELTATIPTLDESCETVRVYLGSIKVESGVQTMRVEVLSGNAEITLFDVNEGVQESNATLYEYDAVNGTVKTDDETLTVRGENGVIFWKDTNSVNYEATITFSCSASVGTDFGLILRGSHYSYYTSQPTQSWRGYYLQFGTNLVVLKRYDYGDYGSLYAARTGNIDLTNGSSHTLVIRAEGNRFTISLDGEISFSADDYCAFFGGKLGVYVGSGELNIHSFEFQSR